MKRVVIGVSDSGEMYVVSKSRNVEVVFKKRKKPTLKKRIRTWLFYLKRWMVSVIQG